MKLLNSNFSPFATRVRMQIAYKNLDIDIQAPEPPLRTEEFRRAYPLGKIPVLLLDDGSQLYESWAIMEYLEAKFPDSSLTPTTPLGKAHASMMCRYADLHLGPALFPLFSLLLLGEKPEQSVIEAKLENLNAALAQGERMMAQIERGTSDITRALHTGDIAMACTFYFALQTPEELGSRSVLDSYPMLTAWWQWVQTHPAVSNGIDEMHAAFMQFLNKP